MFIDNIVLAVDHDTLYDCDIALDGELLSNYKVMIEF